MADLGVLDVLVIGGGMGWMHRGHAFGRAWCPS